MDGQLDLIAELALVVPDAPVADRETAEITRAELRPDCRYVTWRGPEARDQPGTCEGWKCPLCGDVEASRPALEARHGYVGVADWTAVQESLCRRMMLEAA